MNALFYITTMLSIFCALGMLASLTLNRSSRLVSRRALSLIQGRHELPAVTIRPADLRKKLLQAVGVIGERIGMSRDPKLLERFERAGLYAKSYRDAYLTLRVVGPIAGLIAGWLMPWVPWFFMIAFAGVAYLAPDITLTRMVRQRRERIRLGIPDAIDLLVICVDAGLGMDQAMLRVAQELGKRHPDLQQEFLRINREQRAGKPRMDAWQSMSARIQLTEIEAFVNMLMQTERFGTPIARALSNFGDSVREKRRQVAEELAAKTTVKIIFPLVLCIFPSVFIVLLAPPGINILRGMAASGN